MTNDVRLETAYALSKDPDNEILKSEYHKLVLADIKKLVQSFSKDASIDERRRIIGSIISWTAKLPEKLHSEIAVKLEARGIIDAVDLLCQIQEINTPVKPASLPVADKKEAAKEPFKCLGYQKPGRYFYFNQSTAQVVIIPAKDHTKLSFYMIAPFEFWKAKYGGDGDQVNWNAAAAELISRCHAEGTYGVERCRGNGAWHDNRVSLVKKEKKLCL